MEKRILLVEDEPGLQVTLMDRLFSNGYHVILREDGVQGEAEARKAEVDLVLLDVMLPERDGFQVCRNLRDAGIDVPIIMLTARGTNLDSIIGLRQGADDYLTKPFDFAVLLARIEAVLRRYKTGALPGDMENLKEKIRFGEFILDSHQELLFHNEEEVPLTTLEFHLLRYLVNNPNRVISRQTLMDEVWEYQESVSSRTVDVHIAKLRKKLMGSKGTSPISTVRGRGYRFITHPC